MVVVRRPMERMDRRVDGLISLLDLGVMVGKSVENKESETIVPSVFSKRLSRRLAQWYSCVDEESDLDFDKPLEFLEHVVFD